jgi:hypothetical protein
MATLPLAVGPAFMAKTSIIILAQLGLLVFTCGDLIGVLIVFGIKVPKLASVAIFAEVLILEMTKCNLFIDPLVQKVTGLVRISTSALLPKTAHDGFSLVGICSFVN